MSNPLHTRIWNAIFFQFTNYMVLEEKLTTAEEEVMKWIKHTKKLTDLGYLEHAKKAFHYVTESWENLDRYYRPLDVEKDLVFAQLMNKIKPGEYDSFVEKAEQEKAILSATYFSTPKPFQE